jgi:uncharacterized repeat protein (TIGR01451 family)
MKKIQSRLMWVFSLLLALNLQVAFGQVQATVTNTATANGFAVKKQVSNTTVPSGVVFTYTIFYTIPAGATSIVISDQVPASLIIDNVVPGTGCGTPVVNVSGNLVTYSIASVSAGCSGTFQINVHFPAGTTCPGAVARNQVCIEAKNQPKICTDFISTTATANNPFVISKGVTGLSWNPQNNGCQYIMALGGNVTYNLMVYKASPYQGNDDGQINLNSAVVKDVLPAGATLVSSTCGATQSGNTITWNIGSLNAATPWVWQSCQITVNYPAGSFPVNTQIPNSATLSGVNACNQQYSTNSNTTCVQVAAPISSGTFGKGLYLNNKMPGCQGIYYLTTCNNGNTPLTFSVQDVLPAGVTVNSIQFNASAPVTASATLVNSTVSTIASSATGNINWTAPLSSPVATLNFSQTGLAAAACLQIQIFFTINSTVAPNTTITNCANLTSSQIPNQQSCVSFVTATPAPDLCLYKEICSPQVAYQPGNTFRYRLRVQNIGSQNATNFNLSDVLPAGLTYIGNQTAYSSNNYNPSCGGVGSTPWAIANPSQSGNTLTWSNLNIAAECQDFYYANCGAYGTQGVTFYFIEFDVQVAADAPSGIIPNTFTGSGGNLPASELSNVVNTVINVTHGTELTKEISKDNVTWASSTTTSAGGNLWYRLNIKNTGTGALYDVRKVDLLPMNDGSNDWRVMNRALARGAQFGVSSPTGYAYAVVATPPTSGTAGTMAGNNLSILNSMGVSIGSTTDAWPFTGSGNNVGIAYGLAYGLVSGGTLRASFKVTASPNAQTNQQVCNDFVSRGSGKYMINGNLTYTALTPAASNTVCASVVSSGCCEKTTLQAIQGKCCLKLVTPCEVKLIQVTVQGGTISSASWNCSASLGAYLNQSSHNFVPNGCAPTMDMCFDASPNNTTGSIVVMFSITFANGEQCFKEIKLDGCGQTPKPSDCCGEWSLKFKSSHFKKTGIFNYVNPSTKPICSVTILAAAGLSAGQYSADGAPSLPMSSTSLITLTPPAVNSIMFWMSASVTYSSNIILQVNYCDGTFCRDTLKWKGNIINHDVATLSHAVQSKLYAVRLQADPNSRYLGEIAAMAVSLEQSGDITTGDRLSKAPYIFAANAGKVEGENLHSEQVCAVSSTMGSNYVYAQFPSLEDLEYCGSAIEKGLSLVIADNSGSKTPPVLMVTYFDAEGNVLSSRKFSNYISGDISTSAVEVKGDATDFVQMSIYPNPAKEQTTLTYALGRARNLKIDLYDLQGKWVQNLDQGQQGEGFHKLDINTSNLPAGMYFVRLLSDGLVQTQRLSVVK